MKRQQLCLICGCAIALSLCAAGCGPRDKTTVAAATGMRQTGFPGMVTAGGGTSGEVIARSARRVVDGSNAGGTPGTAGGMEGNTGGTKTGGTVTESGHGPSQGTSPVPPAPKPDAR